MRRFSLVTVTAALLLAGCTSGGDTSDGGTEAEPPTSPAPTTTPLPQGPACDDIWQSGKTLPDDYESCVNDGELGEQDVLDCLDGSKLVTYANTMYAVTGGTIVEPDVAPLQDTDEFSSAYGSCTGE